MPKTTPAAKPAIKKPMAKRAAPPKIVVGKTYGYTSRTVPREAGARGKVLGVEDGSTGSWVKLHDKERGKTVTVRPSQVFA